MYRNRRLLAKLCDGIFRAVTHPVSVSLVTNTGRVGYITLLLHRQGSRKGYHTPTNKVYNQKYLQKCILDCNT